MEPAPPTSRRRKRLWAAAIGLVIALGAAATILPSGALDRCKNSGPGHTCINNLRQIDGAKEQWALETRQTNNAPVILSAVNEYIKGGHPKCPSGGTYTYGNIDEPPRCSIADHKLP